MNGTETLNVTQKEIKKYEDSISKWFEQVTFGNGRKSSQVSISSVSSNHSDYNSSDHAKLERKSSLQEVIKIRESKNSTTQSIRSRSNSEGAALRWKNQNPDFEVFPSLPDSVLEKLGLRGDGPRERVSEEVLDQKFTSLALAFTIDATTIKDRCERQRRNRDLTEENLSKEIERFKDKLACMQPLCTDYEKAELFSTLMTQIDVIINATSLVKISAEKYGSVQHEERLTESVDLMVKHVQVLKQQRDSARRQLQHSKRVLQHSPDSSTPSPVHSPKSSIPNKKILTQRRSSLNTISQPNAESDKNKMTRRTSELSLRASSSLRNARPGRLDLGVDLMKIKEGFVDQQLPDFEKTPEIKSEVSFSKADISIQEDVQFTSTNNTSKMSLRGSLQMKFLETKRWIEETYMRWTNERNFHETCRFCALLCFSLGIIVLVNIYIEFELAQRGFGISHIFWSWLGGNNIN